MIVREEPSEKLCLQCQKPLFGRIDKYFCNDTCRNTFNRDKRKEREKYQHPYVNQVINVLRKNHELLCRMAQMRTLPATFSRYELHERGFHFKFFTSIRQNRLSGEIYHFCFEYGWKEISPEKLLIVYNDEQVEV